MSKVQLIHWKEVEGRERARELRAAGFRVTYEGAGEAAFHALKDDPPEAVVIDLTRLPSHGREVANALRQQKRTRHIPLVFAGGEPEKVARVKQDLPDAVYAEWQTLAAALARAIANPVRDPIVPKDGHFYSSKPLAAKLGIRPGASVALVAAPEGFERTLGPLPDGARLRRGLRGQSDLVLWFVRSRQELERALPRMARAAGTGTLIWIGWPKKASGVETDLTQYSVRKTPLAHALVDFKICALDETWSGMCFAQRRGARGGKKPRR